MFHPNLGQGGRQKKVGHQLLSLARTPDFINHVWRETQTEGCKLSFGHVFTHVSQIELSVGNFVEDMLSESDGARALVGV